MRPKIRKVDRARWLQGCFINDYGHPVVNLDSFTYRVVKWSDALIRYSMRTTR